MKLISASTTRIFFLSLTTLPVRAQQLQAETSLCSAIRYPPPNVRSPPPHGYQGHNFGDWTPPSPETLYGIYYVTHSSYEYPNISVVNPRIERYPIFPVNKQFPAGSQIDIESSSLCSDPENASCTDPDAVCTTFGYDVPIGAQGPTNKKYTASWSYAATGALEGMVEGLFAIIAWGKDVDGFGYFTEYRTTTDTEEDSGGIIFASRNANGMSLATYSCVTTSLKQLAEELEDDELSMIVSNIKPLHHDHRRSSQGPVECDEACMNSTLCSTDIAPQLQRRTVSSIQKTLSNADHNRRMLYPLGMRRDGYLPWWGWMTMGLVFGLPLLGGLCVAVPIALFRGHRRRQFARAQRKVQGHAQGSRSGGGSSVAEPQMVQTA